MKITAVMMTPARAAFGMYAKVGIRTPSAINTMAPETAIRTWTTILPKFHFFSCMVYLIMLPVLQTIQHQMLGQLVHNELERMKEAGMA